ncbi:MAG: monofunctional biosynthetic peptidoglycan transglycosylase [Rhodobacteraceae bacterium]|nr:monofunctional biosynthetic peptidoglycan transglycosylase [Paracoccaceae bacterium]
MSKDEQAQKVRESIRLPRKKGVVAKSADRFSSFWARWMRSLLRKVALVCLAFVLCSALLVILLRFANPYLTYYYISERARLGEIQRVWTPIETFSPHMARSIVAAEDAMFCTHFGFDIDAIKSALNDDRRLRGGSTISQQVAKNVFLWQGRTWVRKGLEAWFTLLIELIWPKQRIVEVYLNIAEFDEGIFGAASAGKHYFGVEPGKLTALQAARLAAVLPSPKKRSASRPTASLKKRTRQIIAGAETINQDGRADCFQ